LSERILRWFGDKRNLTVLDMTHEHLELTTLAVKELYEMVRVVGDEPESKDTYYEKISEMEMKADQIRRDMVTELSQRDVFPTERDDLMELVRAVDWIADWAREAGRILVIIPFERLPEELRQSIENMCRENYSCVRVLAKCIRALSGNPRKSLELADQVELLEEDVDELYAESRRIMAEIEDLGMTRGASILLNEFMDAVEMVADWCENTADIARAVAIRAF
jgi:predicted phosphate transport protein (TIGR00153 family)